MANVSPFKVHTFLLGKQGVAMIDVNINTQVLINNNFQRKIVNIFLPIKFNICFGSSKEPSH